MAGRLDCLLIPGIVISRDADDWPPWMDLRRVSGINKQLSHGKPSWDSSGPTAHPAMKKSYVNAIRVWIYFFSLMMSVLGIAINTASLVSFKSIFGNFSLRIFKFVGINTY